MCIWYSYITDSYVSNVGAQVYPSTFDELVFSFHIKETIYDEQAVEYNQFEAEQIENYNDLTVYNFINKTTGMKARLTVTVPNKKPCMLKSILICDPRTKCNCRFVEDSLPEIHVYNKFTGEFIRSIV